MVRQIRDRFLESRIVPTISGRTAVCEMKTQIGYRTFLRKHGDNPEGVAICIENYSRARDAAVGYGADVANFPKRLKR